MHSNLPETPNWDRQPRRLDIRYHYTRAWKNQKKSNWTTKYENRISARILYEVYSIKGAFSKNKKYGGNFITYVKRAEKIFGESEKDIGRVRRVHMRKIKRELKNK